MHTPAHKSGAAGQAEIQPVRKLGDVIDAVMRDERKIMIGDICTELAVCARNAAAAGDEGSARRIQAQIMRLRTLETQL